jgi:cytochrome c5
MPGTRQPPAQLKYLSLILLAIFGAYLALAAAGCALAEPAPQATPTSTADPLDPKTAGMADEPSWIFLNDDFIDSPQAEAGAEVYRLVCSACHGDVGQGLTDAWRAKWDPKTRTAGNPSATAKSTLLMALRFPRYSPPVVGAFMPVVFKNAHDLYRYLKQTMPWQAPGTMRDEEYWQVTAFLMAINGVDLGDTILNIDNAEDTLFTVNR